MNILIYLFLFIIIYLIISTNEEFATLITFGNIPVNQYNKKRDK